MWWSVGSEGHPDLCIQCGDCVDRCPMEALSELDESMEVSADKCIGCGLCVSTCPEEAMTARYSGTATEFTANPLIFQAGNL